MGQYQNLCENYLSGMRCDQWSCFDIRKQVLKETIEKTHNNINHYRKLADQNLQRWKKTALKNTKLLVSVEKMDWGEAAKVFSVKYGEIFCVLNMANSIYPGGGYLEGCAAQEENMFRRSDCFVSIKDNEFDFLNNKYAQAMSDLLCAKDGLVYIDTKNHRVCFRDKEDTKIENYGYKWLDDNEIFPFIEMRAAAQDCRYSAFNEIEATRRIKAQFETLIKNNIKHVVLGAFGCGAFCNPPDIIASIYRKMIKEYGYALECVIFAIHYAGYGPANNYDIFKSII